MLALPQRAKYIYSIHGWSDKDIGYIETNGEYFHDGPGWALTGATAPDGVIWLFPVSQDDIFPLSLWKLIKDYILNNESVVIPMNKNMDKVLDGAKRYNGYLQDNMFIFGDALAGMKFYEGENRWLALKD